MSDGLEGVIAAETVLGHVDGERGVIWVRGCPLPQVIAEHGYEGAIALLWEGFAGEGLNRAGIETLLGAARVRAFDRLGWLSAASDLSLLDAARVCLAVLPDDSSPADILGAFTVGIAALIRAGRGEAPVAPDPDLATAADLLRMIRGEAASDVEAKALETYFTAILENGLNASTFTARIAASTRASLASAVLAGYCTFTGPIHGGAPGPTLDMLDEIEASGDVAGWIERRLDAGGRLMGFGHRVFRVRDPRADALRESLHRLGPAAGRIAFAEEVERCAVAALQRRKPGRSLKMNVEINAALLLDAVGLSREAFTPVFALGRAPSWIAHALEQQKTGRMIRPSSTYVGPVPEG